MNTRTRTRKPTRTRIELALAVVTVLFLSAPAFAQVPTRIPFQGLLLDAGGAPVTATVNLDFSLFDAVTGGSELWSESHLGVVVVDGVYSVELGASNPLTTSVLSGGAGFLEITVDGELLVPRQQLLSVPYALVSDQLGGLPAIYYEQMLEHMSFDGGDPPNLDPAEGFADIDGDGLANFIDPDNDGDGIPDSQEVLNGTNINGASPSISGFSTTATPAFASGTQFFFVPYTFHVQGDYLFGISSATLGSDPVAPYNVTQTGFDFDFTATPTSPGGTLSVDVGGENASTLLIFNPLFIDLIEGNPVATREGTSSQTLTIRGADFYSPLMSVDLGGTTVVPNLLSSAEMTLTLPTLTAGVYTVRINHPNGSFASGSFDLTVVPTNAKFIFVTDGAVDGDFGGRAAADAFCQAEAVAAGVPGTYKAWLSDSGGSPSTTFAQSAGPYYSLWGEEVAVNWADLIDGLLAGVTSRTPTGPPGDTSGFDWTVWTGTLSDGTAAIENCSDWSSASAAVHGRVGTALADEFPNWSSLGISDCDRNRRFHCVEQ